MQNIIYGELGNSGGSPMLRHSEGLTMPCQVRPDACGMLCEMGSPPVLHCVRMRSVGGGARWLERTPASPSTNKIGPSSQDF